MKIYETEEEACSFAKFHHPYSDAWAAVPFNPGETTPQGEYLKSQLTELRADHETARIHIGEQDEEIQRLEDKVRAIEQQAQDATLDAEGLRYELELAHRTIVRMCIEATP
jgi:chromosome segregation ATPase